MLNKILGITALVLGTLIGAKYFGIYDASPAIAPVMPYDIVILGALFLILMQIVSYLIVHQANKGTTLMGKLIRIVLALPAIAYFVNMAYPLNLGIDFDIIIAMFLFAEGLYAMH